MSLPTGFSGALAKLIGQAAETVRYSLPVGEHRLVLDEAIGQRLRIEFDGEIVCQHCGRLTKKSYSQGYCFPCSQRLAACDLCIVKPQLCHFAAGTCREPQWGERHCMQTHVVYLANASGVKVGITRASQLPTRWLDQGARQAVPLYRVKTRHIAGLLEVHLAQSMADKTDWRKLLKGEAPWIDLATLRVQVWDQARVQVDNLQSRFGDDAVACAADASAVEFRYPVHSYPHKLRSISLDAQPTLEGVLQGIKGQYLLFDDMVLNVRKHTGYRVRVASGGSAIG
jgi:hypothetical protein